MAGGLHGRRGVCRAWCFWQLQGVIFCLGLSRFNLFPRVAQLQTNLILPGPFPQNLPHTLLPTVENEEPTCTLNVCLSDWQADTLDQASQKTLVREAYTKISMYIRHCTIHYAIVPREIKKPINKK